MPVSRPTPHKGHNAPKTQTESGHGHSDALAYANACVSVRLVPGNMKFADFRLRTRDKTLYADNISKYA